ncbi:hypothetical protein [Pseudoalteromonas luteoviolacea]|uniref:Uncharacterized protein n=1 Tax=Pseudoalteromonas luteoviolacea DSM 6061 TaxID=1365250 RepID=A0A166X980_9GAMM|nr:hypothetical protein [Pseudoalteromonas luteoviolacea]KZN39826.1 hypothetical protein N475_13795 [Pseudoalteromonas luteoviolacea DSM 6061]MBE0385765.1 hypothetical protein [Pseudoalteromonas luteoviolacea DSM 6061]
MVIDSISESEIDLVIERLRKELGVKSNRALSEKLGLSHSGVAMARKKGTLPYGPIVNGCIHYKISLDEVFGIELDQASGSSSTEEKEPTKSEEVSRNSAEDALAAIALVEQIIDDLLYPKNLDAERELLIRKKLRPMLIEKTFEHNFNEVMVKTIAEGALYMAF